MKNLFRLSLLIAVIGSLYGCAAALIGGGAAGGYYVAKDKGAIGQYTNDAVITSKIKAKYVKDLALKSFGVSVSTNHRVVSLVGAVPNVALRNRAILVAQNTAGVRAVNASNLTINPHKAAANARRAAYHKKKIVSGKSTTTTTTTTTSTTTPAAGSATTTRSSSGN